MGACQTAESGAPYGCPAGRATVVAPACSSVTTVCSDGEAATLAYGASEHLSYETACMTASAIPAPPEPLATSAGWPAPPGPGPRSAGARSLCTAPSDTDGASPAKTGGRGPDDAKSPRAGESKSSTADAPARAESDRAGASRSATEETRASAESASTGASESEAARMLP